MRRRDFILAGAITAFFMTTGFQYDQTVYFTRENMEANAGIGRVLETAICTDSVAREILLANIAGTVSGNAVDTMESSVIGQLMIADVTNYVNIRDQAGTEGEVLGKLYDDSVGTLLEICDDWYKIQSGTVTGYVKAEYVLTGEEGRIRADEVGKRLARVTTTTLKVREEDSTDSIVLGLVPDGDILSVQEETEGWVKVSVEEGEGYVSTEYVELYTENVEAESAEEERIRLEKEEAQRKAAEEAAKKALEAKKKEAAKKAAEEAAKQQAASGKPSSSKKPSNSAGNKTESKPAAETTQNSDAALGQQIAEYAVQFVGNPYVYGGTSLTNGTDCSGFVMSVYSHFGISLPRTSGEQGASGSSVGSIDNAKPGDLVWYSGHIGIYIGNGKLVHASNKKEGIKISEATYRKILGVRRIV